MDDHNKKSYYKSFIVNNNSCFYIPKQQLIPITGDFGWPRVIITPALVHRLFETDLN